LKSRAGFGRTYFQRVVAGNNQGNHGIESRAIPERGREDILAARIRPKISLMGKAL
jgi:hypothetical protein